MYEVLIVDDTLKNIQLAANMLKQEGYKIIFATSGEQALERLKEKHFDTILLDVMMPGMNGYETAKVIKENKKTEEIPIIFLTANADEDSIVEGYDTGAADYITKPFNPIELKLRVKTQCELYTTKRKLQTKLDENVQLLTQYRELVDETSIISKTDIKGSITYVNDNFLAVSGYKEDELIGKPHNIVRHLEVPQEVFKEMWAQISQKKPWKGIVKNRKKDGSYYMVDSYIKPILDSNGDIKEFMSLRKDITQVFELQDELETTQREIISRFGEATESRSKETGEHVKRVAEYSYLLATLYGLSDSEAKLLKDASPMHDIGKIAIPDHILLKPGKLTPDEFEVIKTHTEIGHEILKNSSRPMLKAASIVAHQHHERYDGTGYPRGLKGEDIHIYGRITSIADVFDALGHDRVYKKAWEEERILELFKEERGKQFDPKLIDLFFENIDIVRDIKKKFDCS